MLKIYQMIPLWVVFVFVVPFSVRADDGPRYDNVIQDDIIHFSLGWSDSNMRTPPAGTELGSGRVYSLGAEVQAKFFIFPIPMLRNTLRWNLTAPDGSSAYSYHGDSGVNYFDPTTRYRMWMTTVELGYMLKPWAAFVVSPFAELGMSLGGAHLRFDPTATMAFQGSDFELVESVFLWGYYWHLGLQLNLFKGSGFHVSYKYNHHQTTHVEQIRRHMRFTTEAFNIGLHIQL